MPIAGRFITFEGGEGAGKSTQLARLAERLRADGATVLGLREPGGTPYGERMRDVLKQPGTSLAPAAEALLFASCRAQLVADVIAPALAAGQVVICGPVRPDLTILLDLDPGRGLGRAAVRDQGQADRFELLGDAFHRRVRELYHTLAREEAGRFFVVDAARPPEAIEEEIWHEVVRRFR